MNPLIDANLPAAAAAVLVCVILYFAFIRRDPYADIPAIGSTNFFLSYIDLVRYMIQGPKLLQKGYDKFSKNVGIYRVPTFSSWHVFVCGDKLIDELRFMKGHQHLSAPEAGKIMVSGEYTLGPQIFENQYHMKVMRHRMTKGLDAWFEPLKAEIMTVLEELVPSAKDWTSVGIYQASQLLVARSVNRVVVSDPAIYRDPSYLKLMTGFTMDAVLGAFILGFFPTALKRIARNFLTNIPQARTLATQVLRKNIAERKAKADEHGSSYPDKPNDILSLLIDEANDEGRTEEELAHRVLVMNFAAIHATSMTLSLLLRDLADRPEYLKPLREEAESVISKYGFTRSSLAQLYKLESFIMESLRMKSPRVVTAHRWSMKDYVLSNGVRIPKDTMVIIPQGARHFDSTIFPDPSKFDGFRFCKSDDDNASQTPHFTTSNSSFILFGLGENICPGRFFAATLLKTVLVHVMLNYDVQLNPAQLPRDYWFGPDILPGSTATFLVREIKREQLMTGIN